MSEQPKKHGGRWWLGAMNDALFIIDGPPSPAMNDVGPHVREGHPKPISAAIDERNGKLIVDAHNAAIEAAALRPEAPFVAIMGDDARRAYGVIIDPGGRFNGWRAWRHPDGQWVTISELPREPLS